MTKRQTITEKMKISAMLYRLATFEGIEIVGRTLPLVGDGTIQYAVSGVYFKCGICGSRIAIGVPIHWDHIHPISMAGPHDFMNLRPTHPECNQAKGIKEHKAAAKVRRINNPKPSRSPMKSSGKKIASRPFQKRKKV